MKRRNQKIFPSRYVATNLSLVLFQRIQHVWMNQMIEGREVRKDIFPSYSDRLWNISSVEESHSIGSTRQFDCPHLCSSRHRQTLLCASNKRRAKKEEERKERQTSILQQTIVVWPLLHGHTAAWEHHDIRLAVSLWYCFCGISKWLALPFLPPLHAEVIPRHMSVPCPKWVCHVPAKENFWSLPLQFLRRILFNNGEKKAKIKERKGNNIKRMKGREQNIKRIKERTQRKRAYSATFLQVKHSTHRSSSTTVPLLRKLCETSWC